MGDKKNPGADNRKEMGHSPIKDTRVCIGRPRGESPKRSPGEMAVYDFLDGLGIPYTRLDHEAIFTMESCLESVFARICFYATLRGQDFICC